MENLASTIYDLHDPIDWLNGYEIESFEQFQEWFEINENKDSIIYDLLQERREQ